MEGEREGERERGGGRERGVEAERARERITKSTNPREKYLTSNPKNPTK